MYTSPVCINLIFTCSQSLQVRTGVVFIKLNIFNTVNNEGRSQQSVVWLKHSQSQHFSRGHSLRLAFGSLFYAHHSPPFIFPLINQCDRCLVPLVWGFVAGGHGFASHGGVTLSRGWLCPKIEALGHPRHPPPLSDTVV